MENNVPAPAILQKTTKKSIKMHERIPCIVMDFDKVLEQEKRVLDFSHNGHYNRENLVAGFLLRFLCQDETL